MGDVADMMLDGTLCEGCGDFIGDGDGYPQYCSPQCAEDRGASELQVKYHRNEANTKAAARKRRRNKKTENYREMKMLLEKTSQIIEDMLGSGETDRLKLNNHNQAIKARLMRIKGAVK